MKVTPTYNCYILLIKLFMFKTLSDGDFMIVFLSNNTTIKETCVLKIISEIMGNRPRPQRPLKK
jgi:hypothetical protein